MGVKSKNPKKTWVPGKDMPFFSGKTWAELEDIYPKNKRIGNDIWRMMGLMAPAWIATNEYCKELVGQKISFRDFMMLCFMQRVEEARDNVAFDSYHCLKALNLSGSLYTTRKAVLHKLGFVEKMPLHKLRIYRTTGLAKMLMYNYVDNLQKANDNLLLWVESQPKEHQVKISQSLNMYCSHLFPPPPGGVVDETIDTD
jgi:hypothetical protein